MNFASFGEGTDDALAMPVPPMTAITPTISAAATEALVRLVVLTGPW
jgi:hypothetical protein